MADVLYDAILGVQSSKGATPTAPKSTSSTGGDIDIPDSVLDSLRRVESGKDKFALNKDSKAMGPYQFIPETVQMLHKQGYKFNPFDETEARNMAKTYLQTLAQKSGSLEGGLAAYGGHITKDPKPYVNKVLGGAGTETKPASSNDPLYNAILSGEVKEVKDVKPSKELTQEEKDYLASPVQFNPNLRRQGQKMREKGSKLQPFVEQVAKPLEGITAEDYSKNSTPFIIAKLNFGTPEQKQEALDTVYQGTKKFVGGVADFINAPNKGEIIKKALQEISDNPGKFVGESVKSVAYHPEQIPLGNIAAKTAGEVIGKGVDVVKKGAQVVAETPAYQGLKSTAKTSMEAMQEGFEAAKKANMPNQNLPIQNPNLIKSIDVANPEAVALHKATILETPKLEPINRAEVAPLQPLELNANEALLNKVGIENIRNSAVEMNPKEATSQYLTAKSEQGPYGQGMTNQINYEKNTLTGHFGQLESDLGGIVPRMGSQFEITDKIKQGKVIRNAAEEALESHQAKTKELYALADQQIGAVPVELDTLKQFLDKKSNFVQAPEKSLRAGVLDYLTEQGLVTDKGAIKPMTVGQSEKLRQFINKQYNFETKGTIGDLVNLIDDDVFKNVKGDTYQQARAHFKKGKEVYDNPKAMKDLLSVEGVNQKVPDEKIINKIVTLDESQFKHMIEVFEETGKADAIAQVQTSLINRIKEAGQSAVNEPWNSIAASKEAASIGNKIQVAFKNKPELLEKINDGIAAGNLLHIPTKYPGAAVQTHLLQNKFLDIGIRKSISAAGGAIGSVGGPVGGAVGALAGESLGANISNKFLSRKQEKALSKDIKYNLKDLNIKE